VRSGTAPRPDRIFRAIALVASLGLIVFVVVVITSRTAQPTKPTFADSPPPTLALGTVAPDFSLSALGGGTDVVDLAAFRGTPVVVNFFASWCPNCQAELSAFASFARTEAGHVDVVGVDTNDSDRVAAIRLLDQAHAGYPVGVDPVAKVATRYLVEALPVTYFIDSRGRVAGVALGQMTGSDLDSWLKKLETG
jgi:cytochrome c biogenesis protein CcmG/thiol:disulfide interchange protein DsbE